ncbi:MAG: hypothetical protein KatS3mg108_0747 [Isosphaeraceae bacterium]|jgi:hypothetical protein|nr:MAG: hypothetical protein KatS3mg108_0747 [Isosphaeraceae bacterium]
MKAIALNRPGEAGTVAAARAFLHRLRHLAPCKFPRAGRPGSPLTEDTTMFIESQAADPAVHQLSIRIARRCVFIIQAVLREEERGDALREFYRVCREELDKPAPVQEI